MGRLVCCLFLIVGSLFMSGVKSFTSLNNSATGYTFVVFEDSHYDTDSWFDARKLCRTDVSPFADLAEITDESDVTTVANLLSSSGASNPAYWLGIHNLEVPPSARFTASLQTGQLLTFDKWDSGRPKSDADRCGTVKINDNKWRDEECHPGSKFYGVLCRLPMQPSPIDSNTGCPPTMVPFEGKCYDFHILSGAGVNFTTARSTCEGLPGGRMVVPTSTMQEFVTRYAFLSGVLNFWLGVTDQEVDSEFKGVYGEALDNPKWEASFWGGRDGEVDCIFFVTNGGEWLDDDCYTGLHGILCVVDPLVYAASTPGQFSPSAVSSAALATVTPSVDCKEIRRLLINQEPSFCPLICWAVCLSVCLSVHVATTR
ncbi:macrophage mannose receptor 1-like [Asterias amurensis]|uniref:macrophage mannose receptor 1-like n=1 Tax=Asterias amurensis TaxID=7602 RepID=UPI003AB66951